MSVIDVVKSYEHWLRQHCDVVEQGLVKKHERMASDPLMFFRATCFRFATQIESILPKDPKAPRVLSVGDAHFENWGTWRDAEGRLVWGVNDFDEAAELPYTYDLVRLATSFVLAKGLPSSLTDNIDALLRGYRKGLEKPKALIITDKMPWMQALLERPAAKQGHFEDSLDKLKVLEPETVPIQVRAGLLAEMPATITDVKFAARQRGGGSLGRPRFVAFGEWHGCLVVRESKAIVPSAWAWAGIAKEYERLLLVLAAGRFRSPDPFLTAHDGFIVRRIAADSSKIDLSSVNARTYNPDLIMAMGRDLASIHVASGNVSAAIAENLQDKPDNFVLAKAKLSADVVKRDFEQWCEFYDRHKGE
ncbi:DUF2252 domain-containing protein (plasmid) [Rhizobium sp. Pop5]|uniref:DUF2252 family protein n=1 Tax=Rhizobium sp. Pop5 TaxID=1223565 RepID=UPI000283BBBF|nr:DUF2252 family protein [Rhizobium sp. Pop5]EJZ17862.1 hypothetical protein RCCGEPOP_28609 [Rhizobium sp. Pop5]UVD54880.1 DUF2252 domain-containing protein [Rhizobium sp. Pop5]